MVCNAFRVAAFSHAVDFLRHHQLLLLDNLEVTDDVYRGLGGDEGELVQFLVFEELVGDLDDSLLAEEFACEVDTYGYLVLDSFEVEDVEGFIYVFSGYMVQYGTILQCAYY